jgi:hypothetical protein
MEKYFKLETLTFSIDEHTNFLDLLMRLLEVAGGYDNFEDAFEGYSVTSVTFNGVAATITMGRTEES